MELKELLCSLEERLVQHNNNRREIQNQLQEICSRFIKEADSLEEKINGEIQKSFNEKEEHVLNLIEKLTNYEENNDDLKSITQQVQEELSCWQQYKIRISKKDKNFVDQYNLGVVEVNEYFNFEDENDTGNIIDKLQENLDKTRHSVSSAQDLLTRMATKRRNRGNEIMKRINEELGQSFPQEDARIQEIVNMIKMNDEITEEMIMKAKLTLLIKQRYSLLNTGNDYKLIVKREVSLNWIDFEEKKPSNLIASITDKGKFSLSFSLFSDDEIKLLKTITKPSFKMTIKAWEKKDNEENAKIIIKDYIVGNEQICFVESFKSDTTYCMIMRIEYQDLSSKWSDEFEFWSEFKDLCVWKECPDNVDENKKYILNKDNPRIVSKIGYAYSTIIGNTTLSLNKITSWNIKILNSHDNNGGGIFIGVVPFDIDQNDDSNYDECGWYFYCYDSTLCSGPPHNYYNYKECGPRKGWGGYVHTGDSVGVVMDTTKGELSFVLGEVNLGVAYEGIPLDKPLVPCVLLEKQGDSVEFIPSEVKENVDNSIPVPSNIKTKSETWDSVTLSWDAVEGTSFYQIEVDEKILGITPKTNSFTKYRLFPETEYIFRIRAVRYNAVGEWSDALREKTMKAPDFSNCVWKECPGYVDIGSEYIVYEVNPRIATKDVDNYCECTIIGNSPLPLNKVTSWNIKILKSKNDRYGNIFIGVAPFDIDQNDYNINKCGWYFDCFNSALHSGPPHNYMGKEYGPRKEKGQYVQTGDKVGIIMDTTKGELSFILDEVNFGIAYEGIPLDRPLVPCVILEWGGYSVELDLAPEIIDNVDSSIPVPSNIIAKSITWDSINLTWDDIGGASFYQIEIDGSKSWDATTTNAFIARSFLPNTEHSFMIRAVKGNSVSEWSDAMKGRTEKKLFEYSWWKECPDYVEEKRKCSVDMKNPRIVTKIGNDYCTIIGNASLPLNKVTSWNIKILKSKNNDGECIYIGVAPFDIDQNRVFFNYENYEKCGWYFGCYDSTLFSGFPHYHRDKEYGPRKKEGEYVHIGDIIGIIMDTTKGGLSFVLNGVNLGVAYEGIPLDKPFVPCVFFKCEGDSVELDLAPEIIDNVDSSIIVPSNIITKSNTWNSITLTWNKVEGASFYQIEIDGSKSWDAATTNAFTIRSFLPNTEHSFMVRTVKDNSVSEWSGVVKGRTQKWEACCSWKESPDYVKEDYKYSIDENNPRIASNNGNWYSYCTIIGNTFLPLNKITSWSIKILKSEKNDGEYIYIGVAPSDINQNEWLNYNRCGWYFHCYESTLWSGPPHNYKGEKYGPRKKDGEYVHTGDSVSVVMDTTNGELSFVLNRVNLGVAYEGIPLDKPLVPCIILEWGGDSVELVI